MTSLSDLHIVRPSLGNPLILQPTGLASFELSVAGQSAQAPTPNDLLRLLHGATVPASLVRRHPDGRFTTVPLTLQGARAARVYRPFEERWTDGVLPQTDDELRYCAGFRWEMQLSVALTPAQIANLKGEDKQWRAPLDLHWHAGTALHAVYVHDDLGVGDDVTILQVTDLHVARRNDRIVEILSEVRTTKEKLDLEARYVNFNENLRAVVAYANRLVAQGRPVVVVATGDLVDYYVDGEGEGFFLWRAGKARASRSNFLKLAEIISGTEGRGAGLQCPFFTVPGNHDYLIHEPPLDFDVHLWGTAIELTEKSSYDGFGLTRTEGREYDYWNSGCPPLLWNPSGDVGTRRASVKSTGAWHRSLNDDEGMWLAKPRVDHLGTYLKHVSYDLDHVRCVGPHQLLFMNTGPDRCPTKEELTAQSLFGGQGSHVNDFIQGGSHTRGITSRHVGMMDSALRDAAHPGLVLAFGHAPWVNFPHDAVAGTEVLFEDSHSQVAAVPPNAVTEWLAVNMSSGWRPFPGRLGPPHTAACASSPETAYARCSACRRSAAEYFAGNGYPQRATRHFKAGARDAWIDFQCADGQVEAMLRIVARGSRATRPAPGSAERKLAAYLAGHTHRVHEFRVALQGSGAAASLAFCIDNYSGGPGKPRTPQSLPNAADRKVWLQQHAPLLLTSETTKRRSAPLREVRLAGEAIESMNMVSLPIGRRLAGTERFIAGALHQLLGDPRPCDYIVEAHDRPAQAEWYRLVCKLETRLQPLQRLAERNTLAATYASMALWFNSFGVDFGSVPRNTMDPAVHHGWALGASVDSMVDELAIRIVRLQDFLRAGPGCLHPMSAWYAYESMNLAGLGSFGHAGRDSKDPRVHLQWALEAGYFKALQELVDKYRFQFDRLNRASTQDPRNQASFVDFFAVAAARMAAWGARCHASWRNASVDPRSYKDMFLLLEDDKEKLWEVLSSSVYAVAAAYLSAETEAP